MVLRILKVFFNFRISVMITRIWITQVFFIYVSTTDSSELLPERYLKPKDFNHHPFTDVGIPASLKKAAKITNPYAILAEKRPREGREFPPVDTIYYPTPYRSVYSSKPIETNEINKYDDLYVNVPKNYAFSYMVKDQHSGDDFSHSQAHNGRATRGQYRVKLPDGRTQIVSYTADHKGYRADVQYEDDFIKPYSSSSVNKNFPETPSKLPDILPSIFQKYSTGARNKHIPSIKVGVSTDAYYTGNKKPKSNYLLNSPEILPINPKLNVQINNQQESKFTQDYYNVNQSPSPQIQAQYTSQSFTQLLPIQYTSSTPLYPIFLASTTVAPPKNKQYFENYKHLPDSTSAVIVTPRTIHSSVSEKVESQSSSLVYRIF